MPDKYWEFTPKDRKGQLTTAGLLNVLPSAQFTAAEILAENSAHCRRISHRTGSETSAENLAH